MLVVEQYERICELYYRQKKSQREIAELLGRSRKTVKKAIELRVPYSNIPFCRFRGIESGCEGGSEAIMVLATLGTAAAKFKFVA